MKSTGLKSRERYCRGERPGQGNPQALSNMLRQQQDSQEHSKDGRDLREEIVRLEAEIDELAEVMEASQKVGVIAKVAMAAGGTLLVLSAIGLVGLYPVALISALAALIGGIVLFGSNTSTLKQTGASIKHAEARRAELIGMMALHSVGKDRAGRLEGRGPDPG